MSSTTPATPGATSETSALQTARDAAPGVAVSGAVPLFIIGGAEFVAIASIWRLLGWHLPALLTVHLFAIIALFVNVRRSRAGGADTSIPVMGLIGTLAVGPAGAIGAACLGVLTTFEADDGKLLKAWYDRISMATAVDPVTRHCDNVGVGRAMNLAAASPAAFVNTIETGTMAERQTILGLVARRFHLEYIPALQAALKSPEPVIRVQAAAVASHIRPEVGRLFRTAVGELPDATGHPSKALLLLNRVQSLTASGLLDESDRQQGEAIVSRLGDILLSDLRQRNVAKSAPSSSTSAADAAAFERLLIARRNFAELRAFRSSRRALSGRPTARVRRFGQSSFGGTDLQRDPLNEAIQAPSSGLKP